MAKKLKANKVKTKENTKSKAGNKNKNKVLDKRKTGSSKTILVIVESPAKAKTLKKFLGSNYKISASVGHVRDLPKSYLGIDVDNDFAMKYITVRGKKEIIDSLKSDVKHASFVYLATDPDREGEAIAWHLSELLHLDHDRAKRITFNEITKSAVKGSIENAREIDMNLVEAQQARRALDRIVGYSISPILWHKVRRGLSAGRVQSVALKIICEREKERCEFKPEEYWTVSVTLKSCRRKFEANFFGVCDASCDKKSQNTSGFTKIGLASKCDADKILDFINTHRDDFIVHDVKKGSRFSNPKAPFITSTLQQEASKLLGFSTDKTMRIAQELYEGTKVLDEGIVGLISYIRTDSTRVSDEAYSQAKSVILDRYGEKYLAGSRPVYKSKQNIQDAHEAIRPTDSNRIPESIKDSLGTDQYKLYRLIWQRFIASQMSPAEYITQSVVILNGSYAFKTTGSVLLFDGYLAAYSSEKEKNVDLPELQIGERPKFVDILSQQHFTQPPARFTEAALVKTLEELGVGRPSTYSAIITNIQRRSYVAKENKAFYPTELGEIVNKLLENNFGQIIDVHFTSQMEILLDKIGTGDVKWVNVLKDFYLPFSKTVKLAESKIDKIEIADEVTNVLCDKCGRNMVMKVGRYGKFLACPGFPDCKNTKPYFEVTGVKCPKCGGNVLVKKTRNGRVYYACDNTSGCDFISWLQPIGEFCPKCGSYMVKKSKNKVCSSTECGYSEKL